MRVINAYVMAIFLGFSGTATIGDSANAATISFDQTSLAFSDTTVDANSAMLTAILTFSLATGESDPSLSVSGVGAPFFQLGVSSISPGLHRFFFAPISPGDFTATYTATLTFNILAAVPVSCEVFNSCVQAALSLTGTGVDAPVIPLPAALPLYGTGLAVMGFIGWRRKRKAAAGITD